MPRHHGSSLVVSHTTTIATVFLGGPETSYSLGPIAPLHKAAGDGEWHRSLQVTEDVLFDMGMFARRQNNPDEGAAYSKTWLHHHHH